MTVQDIISTSMSDLGLTAPEETPSPSELTRGQLSLNNLLASWSVQGVPIPFITRENFPLTGAPAYSIGPSATGAVFATTRPLKIEAATVQTPDGMTNPVHIATVEEYEAIVDKTATGLVANLLYY